MPARSTSAGGAPGESTVGRDPVVIAEGVSKQYPGRPAVMFPPVVSIFDRDLNPFGRKKRLADQPVRRRGAERRYDEDDDDDEEDEDEEDERGGGYEERLATRVRDEETFWALKDISFRVGAGTGLGIVGGPESGKSTLMRILARQALPTEGRVLVRDPISPLPVGLAKGLKLSDKGTFDLDLVFGARLLGISGRLMKRHRAEIEEIAQPLLTPDGDPAPGVAQRLSVAAAVVLPSNVILLEEPLGDDQFALQIAERVRDRIRAGGALVLAARSPALAQELCDELIVLDDGRIADRGPAKAAASRYHPPENGNRGSAAAARPVGQVWSGRKLRVPSVVTPFQSGVALLSVELRGATGGAVRKRIDSSDELVVEIKLETSVAGAVVQCDVAFTPPKGDVPRVRLELPEPLRCAEPGTYAVIARTRPDAIGGGPHDVRVEALVSNAAERGTTVIGRDAGRVRIIGGELQPLDPSGEPGEHWDGRPAWRVAADWSVEAG